MNKKFGVICSILFLISAALAQDDVQKFRIYGFADMYLAKSFLKENSFAKTSDVVSDNFKVSLEHLNIYSDFTPNDHLRMLLELGYQQKPITLQNTKGQIFFAEGLKNDTIKKAVPMPSNNVSMGLNKYEWGTFSVERATFQVSFTPQINLLFGKFITPSGIWNVDHGSPIIMTIHQPTQFSVNQIFPKSQVGIMEEGTAFVKDIDINYSIYASTGRDQITIEKVKDISVGGQIRMNLPLLNEFQIGFAGYTGIDRSSVDYTNVIIDSATIAKLGQKVQSEVKSGSITMEDIPTRMSQLIAEESRNLDHYSFTTTDLYKCREKVFSVNLKLKYKRLGIQSEISYQLADNLLFDSKRSKTLAYYGLLSYDAVKKENLVTTPYFCFEHIKTEDRQNNPNLIVLENTRGYQLYIVGLNTKLFGNFGVKLEYIYTDVLTEGKLANYSDNLDFGSICAQFTIAF